jgi:hypothetical protein
MLARCLPESIGYLSEHRRESQLIAPKEILNFPRYKPQSPPKKKAKTKTKTKAQQDGSKKA